MPRKARIDALGALHHIMARGIEGRPQEVEEKLIELYELIGLIGLA